jgi:hypothetical protein
MTTARRPEGSLWDAFALRPIEHRKPFLQSPTKPDQRRDSRARLYRIAFASGKSPFICTTMLRYTKTHEKKIALC